MKTSLLSLGFAVTIFGSSTLAGIVKPRMLTEPTCDTLNFPAPLSEVNKLLTALREPNCPRTRIPADDNCHGISGINTDTAHLEICTFASRAITLSCSEIANLMVQGIQYCSKNNTAEGVTFDVPRSDGIQLQVYGNPPPIDICDSINWPTPVSAVKQLIANLTAPGCTDTTFAGTTGRETEHCSDWHPDPRVLTHLTVCNSNVAPVTVPCSDLAELVSLGLNTCTNPNSTTTRYQAASDQLQDPEPGTDYTILITGNPPLGPPSEICSSSINFRAPIPDIKELVATLKEPGCQDQVLSGSSSGGTGETCLPTIHSNDQRAFAEVCNGYSTPATVSCSQVAELLELGLDTCSTNRTVLAYGVSSDRLQDFNPDVSWTVDIWGGESGLK